jgi:hypothetical protein
MRVVAACKSCGAADPKRKPAGQLGQPAGPCRRCGRLMFWMLDKDEAPLAAERQLGTDLWQRAETARSTTRRRFFTDESNLEVSSRS